CTLTVVRKRDDFVEQLEQRRFDLILSDYSVPGFSGLSALEIARQKAPESPLIFFSGTIGEETAIECLKHSATDYVLKDRPKRLTVAVGRALRNAKEQALRKEAEHKNLEQAALLDKAQDAILLADLDGRIYYWNKGAERLHGWTSAEVIGRNV